MLSVLLVIYPDVGILDYIVILLFFFKELTYILFSIAAALFYIPTNYVQGFQFLHIHTNICHFLFFSDYYVLLLFYSSCPNGCISAAAAAATAAKLLQSCPILCNPIDGSPLGSTVPGILQARTLEWVAISFSSA